MLGFFKIVFLLILSTVVFCESALANDEAEKLKHAEDRFVSAVLATTNDPKIEIVLYGIGQREEHLGSLFKAFKEQNKEWAGTVRHLANVSDLELLDPEKKYVFLSYEYEANLVNQVLSKIDVKRHKDISFISAVNKVFIEASSKIFMGFIGDHYVQPLGEKKSIKLHEYFLIYRLEELPLDFNYQNRGKKINEYYSNFSYQLKIASEAESTKAAARAISAITKTNSVNGLYSDKVVKMSHNLVSANLFLDYFDWSSEVNKTDVYDFKYLTGLHLDIEFSELLGSRNYNGFIRNLFKAKDIVTLKYLIKESYLFSQTNQKSFVDAFNKNIFSSLTSEDKTFQKAIFDAVVSSEVSKDKALRKRLPVKHLLQSALSFANLDNKYHIKLISSFLNRIRVSSVNDLYYNGLLPEIFKMSSEHPENEAIISLVDDFMVKLAKYFNNLREGTGSKISKDPISELGILNDCMVSLKDHEALVTRFYNSFHSRS